MSETQEDASHPLGSFVINPLMVKTEEKKKEVNFRVNDCASNLNFMKERKSDDGSNCEKEVINKDTGINASYLEHAKESSPETKQEEGSVMSNSVKPDVDEPKLSDKTLPMTKPGDVPVLMMKLAVSGPPKCKFDEQKTVLPPSLLHGVTELVKKQQVKDNNRRNSDDSNKELSMNPECLLCRGDTDNGVDVASGRSFSKKISSKDKRQVKKKVRRNPQGDGNDIQMKKEDPVIDSSTSNTPLETDNADIVSFHDYSDAKTSKCILTKSEKDIEIPTSSNLKLQRLEHQDAFVSSEHEAKELSSTYLNEPSTLKKGCEENPFSEIDLDGLLDDDLKNFDKSLDSERDQKTIAGHTFSDVKQTFEEVNHDNKRNKKNTKERNKSQTTEENIYDLTALFSGELEERRKRELKKQKRKAKSFERFSKGKKKSASSDTKDKQPDTGEQEEKPRKPVPNYFVAIQITDQQIKSGLKAVQDKVVAENAKLNPALNKLATLHLTLLVLSLKTEEDMERSRQALDKASEKLLSIYTDVSLPIDVSGLGHFRNNVVFAKVKHDHQVSTLKQVADIVEECFLEQEIISPDQRGFKPHITIMKLSSVKGSKKKGLKKIEEKLYSDFIDTDFGCESIHRLQLCSMMKPKDKQGYYQVEHNVQFAKIPDSELTVTCSDTTVEITDKQDGESELIDCARSNLDNDIVTENTMDIEEVNNEKDLKVQAGDGNMEFESNETDNTSYNDSALCIETDTTKVTKNITLGNDSALELSIETDTPKDTKNITSENDSALELSIEADMPKIVTKKITPENDSALDLSIETDMPKVVTKTSEDSEMFKGSNERMSAGNDTSNLH